MHGAASRFSRTAQEGDAMAAYQALQQVTAACVGCHAGYRVK
jgi:cytochrome c556